MEDLTDVYNDLIMEHSMNSYNKKKLENADYSEIGHNPNCGDEITLELKLNGDKIEDMAFSGHGCAISQASTSIMIDTLRGKTIEEAKEIIKDYFRETYKDTASIIRNYQSFFNSLTIVNEVYIFGHSLSEIDFDYFAEIKKNVSLTCRWYISYHDNIVNAQNLIRRLNIKNFHLFKF